MTAASAWDKRRWRRLAASIPKPAKAPMHEISVAMSIIEIAEKESERRGGLQISAVYLRLGLLSASSKMRCSSRTKSRATIRRLPPHSWSWKKCQA